jgi:hypothetical protein
VPPTPSPPPKLPASVLVFVRLPPDAASSKALVKTASVELSAASR